MSYVPVLYAVEPYWSPAVLEVRTPVVDLRLVGQPAVQAVPRIVDAVATAIVIVAVGTAVSAVLRGLAQP